MKMSPKEQTSICKAWHSFILLMPLSTFTFPITECVVGMSTKECNIKMTLGIFPRRSFHYFILTDYKYVPCTSIRTVQDQERKLSMAHQFMMSNIGNTRVEGEVSDRLRLNPPTVSQ